LKDKRYPLGAPARGATNPVETDSLWTLRPPTAPLVMGGLVNAQRMIILTRGILQHTREGKGRSSWTISVSSICPAWTGSSRRAEVASRLTGHISPETHSNLAKRGEEKSALFA
jgi:hypothetical protein